jgi:hypothetical protein
MLRDQGHIQGFYYGLNALWKQTMHFPKPTFLREGRILEIVRFNDKIRCDVVAEHFQPVALLVGELPDLFLLS